MKKLVAFIVAIIFLGVIFGGTYFLIGYIIETGELNKLETYEMVKEEKIVKRFSNGKRNYAIAKYYSEDSGWSQISFLLEEKDKLYLLEDVGKCDLADDLSNVFIKDNILYLHCIGKDGKIEKYAFNDVKVKKDSFNFNYKNTPLISVFHITIQDIDNNYIYLKSISKDISYIGDVEVKCSLDNLVCEYIEYNSSLS